MKTFTITFAAGLAALAQAVEFTNSNFDVVPGEDFEITWSGAEGPVTILLRQGPSDDLTTLETVTEGADGDSFTWSVPDTFPEGDDYALEIQDGSENNYSEQFALSGGEATPSADESAVASSASSVVSSVSSLVSSVVSSAVSETSEVETTSEPEPTSSIVTPSEASSAIESSAISESESSTLATTARPTPTDDSSDDDEEPEASEVPDSKAGRLGSPAALVLTLAAIFYFN